MAVAGVTVVAVGALALLGLKLLSTDREPAETKGLARVSPPNDSQAPSGKRSEASSTSSGPEYRIARVRLGGRVDVYEAPGKHHIRRVGARTRFGSAQTFSVIDRRGGWLEVTSPLARDKDSVWIEADRSELTFLSTPYSVRVNLSERRVELFRGDQREGSFTVSIGAAGTETPTGRYAVTDLIVGGLNPVYGCCAIALSARQPNLSDEWTGGDRIAIHGSTGPVGAAASNGCLRATDRDVRELTRMLPLGTPVLVKS